ncbi:MAG: hypothetical protein NVSMB44_10280 [Ktedonobacteraceae bacterium]
MHGDVSGLRDEATARVEEGTGEVSSLFYVWRVATMHEYRSHLFCDGSECTAENFKANGIDHG